MRTGYKKRVVWGRDMKSGFEATFGNVHTIHNLYKRLSAC